jgi:long-chain acyl-CoA synthetase
VSTTVATATATATAGPRRAPGAPRSVAEVLDGPLGRCPDAEALVGRHARYSYRQLDAEVERAAAALAGLGLRAGDPVAASLGNHPELVVAFLAAMRLGALWVGVNRVLAPAEKAYLLAHSRARVLLCEPETAAQLEPAGAELPALESVVEVAPGQDGSPWQELLAAARPEPGTRASRPTVDPFAPAAVAYTSGTTGVPKGVVHSQHNLVTVGAANRVWGGWRTVRRQAAVLPLTILNVVALCPLVVFQLDGTCVCVDRRDPAGIAEWVRAERIESFSSVPTIVYDLVTSDEVRPEDLESLSHIGAGGALLPPPLAEAWHRRFGTEVLAGYGSSEAPAVVTVQSPGEPRPPASVGRALPHLSVTVRGDDGAVLSEGEEGEICVAGAAEGPLAGVYTPFLGYLDDEASTAAALAGGVLHTGDVGRLEDGVLHFCGRRSEQIVRGGSKVSPAEVEAALRADPRVADAAVVGRPDERLGEQVVAFVQLAPGAQASPEELRLACAERLASYKVPARLHLVDGFERNAMGKIAKAALAEPPGRPGSPARRATTPRCPAGPP